MYQAGSMPGFRLAPERRKKFAWRSGLFHRHGLIHGAVPVRKGVPAGGDIAAAGGSRWAVAGRLSLDGGSFAAGQRLAIES